MTSAVAGVLVVLMIAGAALAAVYDFGAYRQVSDSARTPGYGAGIRAAVAAVRSRAVPGAAVVVSGYMAESGWTYYQYEYSGRATRTGAQIPRSRAVITARHGDPAITRMVRRYRPPEVFLYVPSGTTQGGVHLDLVAIVAGEPCRRVPAPAVSSGGLYQLDCRA